MDDEDDEDDGIRIVHAVAILSVPPAVAFASDDTARDEGDSTGVPRRVARVRWVRSNRHTVQRGARSAGNERIDVDLNDVDIYDALRSVAMKARISLFLDTDLTGSVTMKAESTAWEAALATIAEVHALRVERLTVPGESVALWISKHSSPAAPQTEFSGASIEARFDETPIRSAARTLSDLAMVNIVRSGNDFRIARP